MAVLKVVRKTMSLYGSTSVITVGHSLGAALSLLDAVYLPLHLSKTMAFRSYLYGLPRVRLLRLIREDEALIAPYRSATPSLRRTLTRRHHAQT
jgi:pimeloyl-ACP methyl ester carboxylesterase